MPPSPAGVTNSLQLVAGSRADPPRAVPSRLSGCPRTIPPARREGLMVAILRFPSVDEPDPNPNALLLCEPNTERRAS